jgi:ribosome-associated heat shock protein Hsp15
MSKETDNTLNRVRIDKWLWAARFYKTRAVAKQAIEGGKVQCEGTRVKPSKEVEVGMEIRLRQGFDEKTVVITALSDQRRGAPEAQKLYQETEDSVAQREKEALARKSQPKHWPTPGRPTKKQRRQIHKFKQGE